MCVGSRGLFVLKRWWQGFCMRLSGFDRECALSYEGFLRARGERLGYWGVDDGLSR